MSRLALIPSWFTLNHDHASLRYIPTQPHLSQRVTRWVEFLAPYNLTCEYKHGSTNAAADALSRNILIHHLSVNRQLDNLDCTLLVPQFLSDQSFPQGTTADIKKKNPIRISTLCCPGRHPIPSRF